MGWRSRIAKKIADEVGAAVDDVKPVVDGMDRNSALQLFAGVAADQPSRAAGRISEEGRKAITRGSGLIGGGAAIGGGALGAAEFQKQDARASRFEAKEQAAKSTQRTVAEILASGDLPPEKKAALIKQLIDQGALDPDDKSGDDDDDGNILDKIIPNNLVSPKGVAFVVVVYFVAKRLSQSNPTVIARGGN